MCINSPILDRSFYSRDTAAVARDLLGKRIIRQLHDDILIGVISEVEAYYGENDSAGHAFRRATPRNFVMFGPAGFAYVYFVYGKHNMFNIVTESQGIAGAVLIRSVVPTCGLELMINNRNGNSRDIANGPVRLCQAFAICRVQNKTDITAGEGLWLTNHDPVPSERIITAPRIGIDYADKKDRDALLCFKIDFL